MSYDLAFWQDDEIDAEEAYRQYEAMFDGASGVSISWSRKDEVVDPLISLARDHGLLTYDPQKEKVYR
ncbi:hypothetical protein ACWEKM_46205 [Streptomyces sp. NPDC004752]